MKRIVITLPYFFDGEAEQIVQLLHQGYKGQRVDLVHIRKPDSTEEQVESLLQRLPQEYYNRLVLHDHHQLAVKYHLYGVHLNSRNPHPIKGGGLSISRSCHSLEEVKEWKDKCNYVSLSPIFDSISKQGYHSAFTKEQISQAVADGIIDNKVYALGGITFGRLAEIEQMGFGGAMILGDAWRQLNKNEEWRGSIVLSIAGSDPSAGAGIQQDLKTISAMGCYGATVITAVTSQNTLGVQGVMPMPKDVVKSQIRSVLDDLDIKAIKIGMIPNKDVAEAIVESLFGDDVPSPFKGGLILDPVMISTSGTRLMEEDCIDYIRRELIPHCLLVTPNIPESKILPPPYPTNFLVKGGHDEGEDMTDTLIMTDGKEYKFSTKQVATRNLHGTGCTLSSAIACGIAKGEALPDAVSHAKDFITKAIKRGRNWSIGHGNGPLNVFD